MSVWKLHCHFCGDTVSTFQLNNIFYKMHLEAVHNIQQNVDSLLQWALVEQGVGKNEASRVVTNGVKREDIKIKSSRDDDGPSILIKPTVPEPLLNMTGISVVVECVDVSIPSINQQSKQEMKQQHLAINKWANGCEHGCRVCRKLGKTFSTYFKIGLLKHLKAEHKLSESEYKEEFKISNLMTKFSMTTCKECGSKVRRSPHSLKTHLSNHGHTIRNYWLKHLKHVMSIPASSIATIFSWMGSASKVMERKELSKPGDYNCGVENCTASFVTEKSLNLHRVWHRKRGWMGRGVPRVDAKLEHLREDCELEIFPMDMLEVNMGNGNEGEIEFGLDNPNDVIKDNKKTGPLSYVGDYSVNMMDAAPFEHLDNISDS